MSEVLAVVRQYLLQPFHAESLIWPRYQHVAVLCRDNTADCETVLRLSTDINILQLFAGTKHKPALSC